jgi:hypothetical protein
MRDPKPIDVIMHVLFSARGVGGGAVCEVRVHTITLTFKAHKFAVWSREPCSIIHMYEVARSSRLGDYSAFSKARGGVEVERPQSRCRADRAAWRCVSY